MSLERTAGRPLRLPRLVSLIALSGLIIGLSGCATAVKTPSDAASPKQIEAVGSAPQFSSLLSQVGGKYVKATYVMGNPDVAPHSFQTSPKVAQLVANAQIVVQNGLGFDSFMNKIESAQPTSGQKIIQLQTLLGLPDSTANPHLFYKPTAISLLANAIAKDLSAIEPAHAGYFRANAQTVDASVGTWLNDIAKLKRAYGGTAVISITPVGDDLLQAAGLHNLTPWRFQADIMNGVSPAPQDVTLMQRLIVQHKVKVVVHNHNVSTPTTNTLIQLAEKHHLPTVALYGTMPPGGYTYQSWMEAETDAIYKALADAASTPSL